ncbi:Two component transcriptional regulator, LuxR family [Candidatus Sulfopaludibacter sp. SbA3]|nr:Two component transcriptional regulator, LuxR family [Candidatus Sulfopaludibacter sp. SbA3]
MSAPEKFTVLIVDDHPIMRLGIAAIIDAQPDMRICAQAASGEDAVRMFRKHHPDVTLMDLRLPGMSGLAALKAIRQEDGTARCVVLTTYEGDEDIHQALAAGAAGYIIKAMSHETLVEALRRVYAGSRFLPSPVARSLASRTPNSDLSPREREVLSLMVQGRSNKEIGTLLGITEATVKSHVSVILERLGVADRTQAVVAALQRGLEHL